MSIQSNKAKARASLAVDRLLGTVLSDVDAGAVQKRVQKRHKSSAESLKDAFENLTQTSANHSISVKAKQKQKKLMKKKALKHKEDEKRFEHKMQMRIIERKMKNGQELSTSEEALLKQVVDSNVSTLQKLQEQEPGVGAEIEELRAELKKMKNSKIYDKSVRVEKVRQREFKMVKRYPGLTPGLAPVDMEDSDSDDE